MSAKMSDARRDAFFRALEATGNVTLAAEAAKVSRSWVLLHRKENPGFDARCRAAIALARASFDRLRTSGEGGILPPSGWGFLDGCELVVRGSNGRRVQVARARLNQITPSVERRILQLLSATCNMAAACAEAGVSVAAVWAHRQRWPGFDRKCAAALEEGFERLLAGLAQNGRNLFAEDERAPELPMPPMTFSQAIHLVHMHKHLALGIGKAPGTRWRPPPTLAETLPGIWAKMKAFERERRLGPDAIAAEREEWRRRGKQAGGASGGRLGSGAPKR